MANKFLNGISVLSSAIIDGSSLANGSSVLDVQGTQGQLFSVTDDLSGQIFAVSDISGVPIMTVNSSGVSYFDGKVGIGTNSPSAPLEIAGVTNATDTGITIKNGSATRLRLFHNDSAGSSYLTTYRGVQAAQRLIIESGNDLNLSGGGGSAHMVIKTSGNVGIGTTSPDTRLEVRTDSGAAVSNSKLRVTAGAQGAYGGTAHFEGAYNDYGNVDQPNIVGKIEMASEVITPTDVGGVMKFFTKATGGTYATAPIERMRINSSGNVGIGETSPDAPLHIKSTNYEMLKLEQNDANAGLIHFLNTDDTTGWFTGIAGTEKFIISRTADNTSPIITAEQNGNVGIGTDSPIQELHVVGDIRSTHKILVQNSLGSNLELASSISNQARISASKPNNQTLPLLIQAEGIKFGTVGGGEKMRMDSSGNLGINTTLPDFKLDVDGTFGVSDLPFNTDSVSVLVADETIASEIITNGGFDTDLTDWTNSSSYPWTSATWTSSGVSLQTSGSAQYKSFYQDIGPITSGKTYKISYSAVRTSGTMRVGVETSPVGSSVGYQKALTSSEVVSEVFTATTTDATCVISFWAQNDSSTNEWVIDNVSIKEVTSASNQIQKRELGTGAFGPTPVGAYLPLAGGTMTGTNGVLMPDNFKLKFGDATTPDLEIYHDGSSSRIKDAGVGNLTINATDFVVNNSADTKNMIIASDGGSVNLYYNASQKFRTISAGVEVTGNIDLPSNGAILFDNTNNTEQYYIRNGGGSQSSFQVGKGNPGSDIKLIIDDGGNVGIGTTSPGYKLSVDDNSVTNIPKTLLQFDANSIADNGGYNIDFRTSSNDTADRYVARIRGIRESTGALSQLSFWTESGTALEQRMTIRASGKVGIGTTTPGEKLDVNGNIKIQAALLSNQENTNIDTGAEVVAQVSTSLYTAAFFDFVIKKVGNIRSGTVYACHDGTNVEFTETSTQDLGDTSDVVLSVDKSGTNLRLIATVASDDWIIKSLIKAI